MMYFGPAECCKFLKKDLNDINASDLKTIAELERPFACRYHDYVDRSPEEREEHVVKGKHGELITMISLAKSGYKIIRGVRISEQNDPADPDDGSDIKIELGIQVKTCDKHLNINSYHQEEVIEDCFKNNVTILVCHHMMQPNGAMTYELRHLTKQIFDDLL